MLEFLPPRILHALRQINLNRLYELRLRADKPLRGCLGGAFFYLGESGVCAAREAIVPTREEVGETLFAASGYSVYAVENQIRQGFVTAVGGERIGIAGSYVYSGREVLSVNGITSLCIRIPHAIEGCAEKLYRLCLKDGIVSLLILSPPGEGKTTLLRDLCRIVSMKTAKNILVSDERGELSAGDLGDTADVIRYADKLTAFTAGIRAMRPDIIVTDELLPEDYIAVRRAMDGGIDVFASAHLTKFDDVPQKIFERYILLDGLGEIGAVLDREGNRVD